MIPFFEEEVTSITFSAALVLVPVIDQMATAMVA